MAFGIFLCLLTAAFGRQLWVLCTSALDNNLNSYIVLIPFVSLYFLGLDRSRLRREYRTSLGWAVFPGAVGLSAIALIAVGFFEPLSPNNRMAAVAFSFVCLLWAGGFAILGRKFMASAAFPMFFLIFLVPLPDQAVETMETALKVASAEAASVLFGITGTPAFKTGPIFQLPGFTMEVAQECSGIRSTWVLFITSLVAAQLFLAKPLSRLMLVAAVLPLGIVRNGFRIMVIGLLCIHVDPSMIHSFIHRRGGPIFFALSLIPLLLILWVLRRRELAAIKRSEVSEG
ncbi:MAG TPA: exosortase/archaeosortase family protein [Chthoniobacterales bacterium]|nr:exosortase/archaeosortase family protein [Chthoniobacterales bacterium]